MKTDVLIVGAGPTGLALAISLKRAGIDCLVVEKRTTALNTSRAAVIHAHTLDVLESLGVAERLERRGLKLNEFTMRDRDQPLMSLRFGDLPSAHAHLLMLPQDQTELVLRDALAEAGGAILWGAEIEAISQSNEGVTASLQMQGKTETVLARYAVGADGMQSVVRTWAGINFSGGSYEESFMLADVTMEWPLGQREVSLFLSPAGMVVVAPLPEAKRYRIVAMVDQAPEIADAAFVQALLDARGPTGGGIEISEVLWYSRFRLHHRVADSYRAGRLFLIGDAAHVHSPAGGQGMNTGLVDACVLGDLLADVLAGRRDERELDKYESKRRPAAEQVIAMAGRLTAVATVKNTPRRLLRNMLLRFVDKLPFVKRKIEMNLSGLSRRAAAQL